MQILKLGGIGILGIILGLLMFYAGYSNLIISGRVAQDGTKKPSCSTVMNGLGQLFFGLLFFSVGLIMIAVVFFQEVLPWLGL